MEPLIDRIIIHPESQNSEVSKNFIKAYPNAIRIISDHVPLNLDSNKEVYFQSKKQIFIRPFEGKFVTRCLGYSPNKVTTCCSYHTIDLIKGCNYSCSYCFLQDRLKTLSTIEIFSNPEALTAELTELYKEQSNIQYVIGLSESNDFLGLDQHTLFSQKLFPVFKNLDKWNFNVRTKSANVDQFLNISGSKNIGIHWSINPQVIIDSEEHFTANLEQRLEAAKKCLNAGYSIGFLFFPLIYIENWQSEYSNLINRLVEMFSTQSESITISIAPLDMNENLIGLIKDRYPVNNLGIDNLMNKHSNEKYRLQIDIRRSMYEFVLQEFKKTKLNWKLRTCPTRLLD